MRELALLHYSVVVPHSLPCRWRGSMAESTMGVMSRELFSDLWPLVQKAPQIRRNPHHTWQKGGN